MNRRGFVLSALAGAALPAQTKDVDKATVDRWMRELSNWGRWGKQDQRGAVNLITPAKRKQALQLVRDGVPVSLARDTEKEKAEDNPRPFVQEMTATGANPAGGQFAVDTYFVLYHGYAHTHMDSLCHMFHEGRMYNGYSKDEVTAEGARLLAINTFKDGIFTRGILLDIPQLKGVPYLDPGTPVYPEDLDAWEKKSGARVGPGDVVFLRTGRWARRAAQGPWNVALRAAGMHASCAPWLRKRDVAMVGSDAGTDVLPSRVDSVRQPMHQLLLVAMGTPIFDNCDLEAISAACAQRKRWEFLLTAAPISVKGGTGSPLNPVAIL